jgi:hypothetical protein
LFEPTAQRGFVACLFLRVLSTGRSDLVDELHLGHGGIFVCVFDKPILQLFE